MAEVSVETHGKCQLSILTTMTECHQTSVQKSPNTKLYKNRFTGSQQSWGQAARLQGAFLGNSSFTDARKGVQKWTSYEPDRLTNYVRTVNRRTQEQTQEAGPCAHQDVVLG